MIEIALASNGRYFPGLAATVVSLLLSNRQNPLHLHIIDGGLSQAHIKFIRRKAAATNPANRVTLHTISGHHFAGFTPDYGNSYMSYARIMVGSHVMADRVIYLDTDLLVAANFLPLWRTALAGNVAAAVQDDGISFLHEDYPFDDDCSTKPYFNAGVMLIDLRRWRETEAQDRLLQMIAHEPRKFRWWDQTAMNALFHGQILFLDSHWNIFADRLSLETLRADAIFHYVGPSKPWQRCLEDISYKVWRSFFAQHVRSEWTLFSDPNFTRSFIREKRHLAARRLRSQPTIAVLTAGIRALFPRHNKTTEAGRFTPPHSPAPSPAEPQIPSRPEIDAYVRRRWGRAQE